MEYKLTVCTALESIVTDGVMNEFLFRCLKQVC